jgi:cell division septum initiation protein DivIVA
VPDFLDDTRREISDRLKELKPLVDEFRRLEAAAAALAGVGGSSSSAAASTTRRRKPGRPRKAKAAARTKAATATKAKPARKARSTGRRAGRRKGSGTRAAEALSLVKGQPGITIPELAAKMGIKQNYLYRVLPGLEQEKKVRKEGRGWYPKG